MAFNKAAALQEAERSVTQGKISQAIRQYFHIFERDPSDVILLNTIGDLYIRERNLAEGLKLFYRLAEAYVQDGFTPKAIAIYKKIAKLEPDSEEPLLRLVGLYQAQRLGREARELYYQIAECYKKKKQNDKVLEILRKVVQLDVENITAKARLAAFCEEVGYNEEAAQVHLELAQLAFRREDTEAARSALKKAQELNPYNPQIQLLKAREALALKHPEEAEAILSATPGLKEDPAGRSLLVDSYLALRQLEKAETLVLDCFRANPADFSPLASFVSACVEASQFDAAFKALAVAADELIARGNTSSLMESLRLIWSKSPRHLPTLELIFRVCQETGDEHALPEILEALGQAYMEGEQFAKAEQIFQKLVDRQPTNEHYKVLLRQVLKAEGKELGRADVANLPALGPGVTPEGEGAAPAGSGLRVVDREAIVKEALENSDLLAHYHLVRKAVAELDKVLEIFPDETEIHRRLIGMCWRDMPERAEQAAQALERIHRERGDEEAATTFAQMPGRREAPGAEAVGQQGVRAPAVGPGLIPPFPPQAPATAAGAIGLDLGFLSMPVQEAGSAATPQVPLTASPGVGIELPRPSEREALTPTPAQAPAALGIESLNSAASGASPDLSVPPAPIAPPSAPVASPIELEMPAPSVPLPPPASAVGASAPPAPVAPPPAPLASPIELEMPASFELLPAPDSEIQEIDLSEEWESFQAEAVTASTAPETADEAATFNYDDSRIEVNFYLEHGLVTEARKAVKELEERLPGDPRVGELRALVDAHKGAGEEGAVAAKQPAETAKPARPKAIVGPAEEGVGRREVASGHAASSESTADAAALISPLGDLLEEIGEAPGAESAEEDDPESHYNLGIAFREMSLLDEAIGEFQQVVKGAGKGNQPPYYLQACTLLATCFMDKGMAAIAVKWYSRALETRELDDEASLALLYDLGVAYEQAGDLPHALEKFTEVYAQNIDYRDVAEKLRTVQQKGS
jgi:tetratricopeptide (TPR) repeat protein